MGGRQGSHSVLVWTKKMAKYKTEATVRKKIEEYVAKSGVFKRDDLKDLRYDMKDFLEEWKKQLPIVEEEKYECCRDVENISLPAAFWDFL